MPTALPADVKYGYVADVLLRAVLDTSNDPDELPDGIPAKGTVTLNPVGALFTAGGGRTGIVASPYEFQIHQGAAETTPNAPVGAEYKGQLVNPNTGHTGVQAVVTGWYNVGYKVDGYQQQYGPFHITEEFTAENPFWIRENIPLDQTPEIRFVVNEAILNEVRQIRDDLANQGATPDQIAGAVAQYMADNPVEVDVDLSGYALVDHTHDEYLTQDDLPDIPEPPDLSVYATKQEVIDGLAGKADDGHTHENYLTADDIPAAPDLTPYATRDEVSLGLGDKADKRLTIRTTPEEGTTLTEEDAGCLLVGGNPSQEVVDIVVPANVFEAGDKIDFIGAAGRVRFVAGQDLYLAGTPSLTLRDTFSAASIVFLSPQHAVVVGDLE